jgi:NAD(P)-dependent dehydrogenase (short-subunit alcohol dehydrogenase family)
MKLKNKVAIVTGGSRGIGKAIASTLASEGADIALFGIHSITMRETAKEIEERGRKALALETDVSVSAQVNRSIQKAFDTFGKVDILVNNAAIESLQDTILELSDEQWAKEIAVNLSGPFYCMRAVLPHMITQRSGKIVTIGSIAGQMGRSFASAAYCASKAGIVGLTMSVAMSVGKYGINVNVVTPGPIQSTMMDAVSEEKQEVVGRNIVLSRTGVNTKMGLPQDIANAVLFMASSDSDWITGVCLNVAGGILMG